MLSEHILLNICHVAVKPAWEGKKGTVSLAASSPTCIAGSVAGVADILLSQLCWEGKEPWSFAQSGAHLLCDSWPESCSHRPSYPRGWLEGSSWGLSSSHTNFSLAWGDYDSDKSFKKPRWLSFLKVNLLLGTMRSSEMATNSQGGEPWLQESILSPVLDGQLDRQQGTLSSLLYLCLLFNRHLIYWLSRPPLQVTYLSPLALKAWGHKELIPEKLRLPHECPAVCESCHCRLTCPVGTCVLTGP